MVACVRVQAAEGARGVKGPGPAGAASCVMTCTDGMDFRLLMLRRNSKELLWLAWAGAVPRVASSRIIYTVRRTPKPRSVGRVAGPPTVFKINVSLHSAAIAPEGSCCRDRHPSHRRLARLDCPLLYRPGPALPLVHGPNKCIPSSLYLCKLHSNNNVGATRASSAAGDMTQKSDHHHGPD